MTVTITYDVSDKNTEFKAALIERKFSDSVTLNGVNKPLPESTLIKAGTTERAAINDMREVAKQLNIELERAFAISPTGFEIFP